MKREKEIPKICKNGDERELPFCDSVFLDACIAQAHHQSSLNMKNNLMKNEHFRRTEGLGVFMYRNPDK